MTSSYRCLSWHEGTHAWDAHDGFPRHQHSLNGALTISPDSAQLCSSWGPAFLGEPGSRGDSAPRGDSLAGLIADLGLVLSDAIRRRAGLLEQNAAAVERLQHDLAWEPGQSAAEITGRLAVALAQAQAQAREKQDSGRPEDPASSAEQEA